MAVAGIARGGSTFGGGNATQSLQGGGRGFGTTFGGGGRGGGRGGGAPGTIVANKIL